MTKLTKEQLIEDLKASTQNASGMFEIGEETICELVALLTDPSAQVSVPDLKPVGFLFVSDDGAVAYSPAGLPMKGFNLICPIYGDVNACRAAMLQSFGNSEQLDEVGSWNNHMNTPTAQAGNSPVIGIDMASEPDRSVEVRYPVPPGYVMVPKEMTDAIGEAIAMQANCCGGIALDIYDAMLAAAPQQEVNRG